MKDLSFIIPIRVDTEDRIDNCLCVLQFLKNNFPQSEVLLIEQDSEVRTDRIVEKFPEVKRLFYRNAGRFSKSAAVNAGIDSSTRDLICMCDTDILLHPNAIHTACQILRTSPDRVVIPHNRIFVDVSGALKQKIAASLDMETYGRIKRFSDAPVCNDVALRNCNGGIFLATKHILLLAGGLNKKMVSYGWEDTEFIRRMDKLGHYTFMLPQFNLVHLDHRRGKDSKINEMFDVNRAEFEKINRMNKRQLQTYVDRDLNISKIHDHFQHTSIRRKRDFLNLLTFQWLAHFANKFQVNTQIMGGASFLLSLIKSRGLRGFTKRS